MAFDATIGGTGSNSYASVDDADAYFILRIGSDDWDDLTESKKEAYLVTATMMLETAADWYGQPSNSTQLLHFPATGFYNTFGQALYDSVIPPNVVKAVCEQALYLTQQDTTKLPSAIAKGLSSMSAGPVSLTFDKYMIAKRIAELVPGLLKDLGSIDVGGSVGGMNVHDVYSN